MNKEAYRIPKKLPGSPKIAIKTLSAEILITFLLTPKRHFETN
jgi:hypothetical protein